MGIVRVEFERHAAPEVKYIRHSFHGRHLYIHCTVSGTERAIVAHVLQRSDENLHSAARRCAEFANKVAADGRQG